MSFNSGHCDHALLRKLPRQTPCICTSLPFMQDRISSASTTRPAKGVVQGCHAAQLMHTTAQIGSITQPFLAGLRRRTLLAHSLACVQPHIICSVTQVLRIGSLCVHLHKIGSVTQPLLEDLLLQRPHWQVLACCSCCQARVCCLHCTHTMQQQQATQYLSLGPRSTLIQLPNNDTRFDAMVAHMNACNTPR